jgi:hypothetical protein
MPWQWTIWYSILSFPKPHSKFSMVHTVVMGAIYLKWVKNVLLTKPLYAVSGVIKVMWPNVIGHSRKTFLKSEFTCQFSFFLNIHDLRRCYIIILRNNSFIFNFIIMSWKENLRPSKSHLSNKNNCYTYLQVFFCFEYSILIRFISNFFKCSHNTLGKALWKCTHKIQYHFNLRVETKKIRTLLHEAWPILTKMHRHVLL